MPCRAATSGLSSRRACRRTGRRSAPAGSPLPSSHRSSTHLALPARRHRLSGCTSSTSARMPTTLRISWAMRSRRACMGSMRPPMRDMPGPQGKNRGLAERCHGCGSAAGGKELLPHRARCQGDDDAAVWLAVRTRHEHSTSRRGEVRHGPPFRKLLDGPGATLGGGAADAGVRGRLRDQTTGGGYLSAHDANVLFAQEQRCAPWPGPLRSGFRPPPRGPPGGPED